eukprot:CAMPEP_0177721036 /NCGR_PEP_ID=MMETSP0484_2-20121128/16933_1 /TAXON_ID=354590 /ORGANISM="Rhodomonas lens, Strain RHODO" /LENGTH=189 /DNA_ID=CAMNT_0019233315 /DNA_START=24 /DNA_END=590 /DNA_ORIENTATION=+
MRPHSWSLAVLALAAAFSVSDAFAPSSLSALTFGRRPLVSSCRRMGGQRLALKMQENPWQWDAAKQQYFDPNSGVYYDPNTGEYIQPPAPPPPAPPPPPKPAGSTAGMSARDLQMQRVLERQRIQDAEKLRKGALALESNRPAVILGVLFIGTPVIVLLVAFLTGALPNPFEAALRAAQTAEQAAVSRA